jgi:hypothetical protein
MKKRKLYIVSIQFYMQQNQINSKDVLKRIKKNNMAQPKKFMSSLDNHPKKESLYIRRRKHI